MKSNDNALSRRKFLTLGAATAIAPFLAQAQTGRTSAPASSPAGVPNGTKKYQAKAPDTQRFDAAAFKASQDTTVRWLGGAGFFINTRGTTLMIDPLLEGYDMPVMIDMPIMPKGVPRLDAVLVTHADTDHYSVATCRDLKAACHSYRSTTYVASVMKNDGLASTGYDIGEQFHVGAASVRLTAADHDWQNAFPRPGVRHFEKKDCCGFWIDTPDGTLWATGDSRLMPEQLQMPQMDAILFDYSEDAQFHMGLEGSVKLANAYPETPLLLGHWGTVDAPEFAPFNGDPKRLIALVQNPERVKVLAPGQPFRLQRLKRG